ncbi:serine/threonine protein kinase [Candidatus Micrarchaeota archaeon]|nr:serine/threonine protein kinase [Candidatus Micrarchaeota archaeon]
MSEVLKNRVVRVSGQAADNTVARMDTIQMGGKFGRDMPHKIIVGNGREYVFSKEIGSGGGGSIFKTVFVSGPVRKIRAVKILSSRLSEDEQARKDFETEAGLVSGLKHPSIVEVFDFGVIRPGETLTKFDGCPYFVMEYLDGSDLDDVIMQKGVLSWTDAQAVSMRVCAALSHAHENDIIHRDIKPRNIFIIREPNGKTSVKVLDFGIAKIAGDRNDVLSGTPEYMPPEQVNRGALDLRTDLYSTGATMYEMMLGRPPFTMLRGEELADFLYRVVNDAPVHILNLSSVVPRSFAHVVHKAMEKDPRDRYASANEMRDAIAGCKDEPKVHPVPTAISASPKPKDVEPHAEEPNDSVETTEPRKRSSKLTVLAVAAVALVIGLLGGFGINWLHRNSNPTNPITSSQRHEDAGESHMPVKTEATERSLDAGVDTEIESLDADVPSTEIAEPTKVARGGRKNRGHAKVIPSRGKNKEEDAGYWEGGNWVHRSNEPNAEYETVYTPFGIDPISRKIQKAVPQEEEQVPRGCSKLNGLIRSGKIWAARQDAREKNKALPSDTDYEWVADGCEVVKRQKTPPKNQDAGAGNPDAGRSPQKVNYDSLFEL